MDLIKEILASAPLHVPEFEARIFDMSGRLVALLPLAKPEVGILYASEPYAGPNIHAIVTLYRDGAPVAVICHGLPIGAGFNLNVNIPYPDGAFHVR